jgi:hypothetical protein
MRRSSADSKRPNFNDEPEAFGTSLVPPERPAPLAVFSDPLLFAMLVLLRVQIRLLNLAGLVDLLEVLIAQNDRISVRRCDVVARIVRARLLPPAAEEGGSASMAYMVRHESIIAACDTRHQFLGISSEA